MKRTQGAVKLGTLTPFFNNVVRYLLLCLSQHLLWYSWCPPCSLVCGITVFSTVFSIQMQENVAVPDIVETLKTNGEANTGLTFIWLASLTCDVI